MRKYQMVQTFQKLDAIEETVGNNTLDTLAAIEDLRSHLEGVRAEWWEDSTKFFQRMCRTLDAFYREAWSPEFVATDKKKKARNRYANIILDQIRQSYR